MTNVGACYATEIGIVANKCEPTYAAIIPNYMLVFT